MSVSQMDKAGYAEAMAAYRKLTAVQLDRYYEQREKRARTEIIAIYRKDGSRIK